MAKKRTFSLGDVLNIMLEDGRVARAKVVFKSKYFAGMDVLSITGWVDQDMNIDDFAKPKMVAYAIDEDVGKLDVELLRNEQVSDAEHQLTLRRVAFEKYVGDHSLGRVTDEEFSSLPEQGIANKWFLLDMLKEDLD